MASEHEKMLVYAALDEFSCLKGVGTSDAAAMRAAIAIVGKRLAEEFESLKIGKPSHDKTLAVAAARIRALTGIEEERS